MSHVHKISGHQSRLPGIEAMTLVSNNHFPRHSHDQFGIGVIAFGAQRSWSGVGHVDAEAGDVIMVNPGEMHDGTPLNREPRGWRMLYFDPALVAREVEHEVPGAPELVRPVARDPLLASCFARLFANLIDPQADGLDCEEHLLAGLITILRTHGASRPISKMPLPGVAKAIKRIDAAPELQVSLAELASLAKVTRFQLLRAFARETGATPHAYLVQRRIRLVKQLLAQGLPLSHAAAGAGFADQSHMTRAFVRQLGITPGNYRNSLR